MESESNTSENILFIDITYKQYIVVYLTFTYYIVCRLYVRRLYIPRHAFMFLIGSQFETSNLY
jgi:hypothetical protein